MKSSSESAPQASITPSDWESRDRLTDEEIRKGWDTFAIYVDLRPNVDPSESRLFLTNPQNIEHKYLLDRLLEHQYGFTKPEVNATTEAFIEGTKKHLFVELSMLDVLKHAAAVRRGNQAAAAFRQQYGVHQAYQEGSAYSSFELNDTTGDPLSHSITNQVLDMRNLVFTEVAPAHKELGVDKFICAHVTLKEEDGDIETLAFVDDLPNVNRYIVVGAFMETYGFKEQDAATVFQNLGEQLVQGRIQYSEITPDLVLKMAYLIRDPYNRIQSFDRHDSQEEGV